MKKKVLQITAGAALLTFTVTPAFSKVLYNADIEQRFSCILTQAAVKSFPLEYFKGGKNEYEKQKNYIEKIYNETVIPEQLSKKKSKHNTKNITSAINEANKDIQDILENKDNSNANEENNIFLKTAKKQIQNLTNFLNP